jgi:hypothetical protein
MILPRVPSVFLTRVLHGHADVNTKANVDRPALSLVLPVLATGVDCTPLEPPPQDSSANDVSYDINAMLECIPHKDQEAFA